MFKGLVDWCRAYFQHPAILLFMIVSIGFFLLGVLNQVKFPGFEGTLTLGNSNMWIVCMVVSALFLALAFFMMYNPPAGWRTRQSLNDSAGSDEDACVEVTGAGPEPRQSFHARRMSLSDKQKKILSMIEQERQLSFHVIKTELGFESDSELYYRLEQIRLLGFVEKEKLRESASSTVRIYKLAEPYSALLGGAEPDETGFAVTT